jgi:hypothetical protein
MADDNRGFFQKFQEAFDEEPKSNQPDKRALDKNKVSDFSKGFNGESDKQAAGPMQRRMDQLKKGGY